MSTNDDVEPTADHSDASESAADEPVEREPASRISTARAGAERVGDFLARTDRSPSLVRAATFARKLATDTGPVPELDLSRSSRLSDRVTSLLSTEKEAPSASRELALAAVGVWQTLIERRHATASHTGDLTIMFTDLVSFSTWALNAGDDNVLALIGEVNRVSNEIITDHRGRIVKSLGDGLMAVFTDAADAIVAAFELCGAASAITVGDYRAQLRAGVHTGTPRKVGDDYLGVDVNIAARVADAAGASEVLATSDSLASAPDLALLSRKRRFRAKGTPTDIEVFAVVPRFEETPSV